MPDIKNRPEYLTCFLGLQPHSKREVLAPLSVRHCTTLAKPIHQTSCIPRIAMAFLFWVAHHTCTWAVMVPLYTLCIDRWLQKNSHLCLTTYRHQTGLRDSAVQTAGTWCYLQTHSATQTHCTCINLKHMCCTETKYTLCSMLLFGSSRIEAHRIRLAQQCEVRQHCSRAELVLILLPNQ